MAQIDLKDVEQMVADYHGVTVASMYKSYPRRKSSVARANTMVILVEYFGWTRQQVCNLYRLHRQQYQDCAKVAIDKALIHTVEFTLAGENNVTNI